MQGTDAAVAVVAEAVGEWLVETPARNVVLAAYADIHTTYPAGVALDALARASAKKSDNDSNKASANGSNSDRYIPWESEDHGDSSIDGDADDPFYWFRDCNDIKNTCLGWSCAHFRGVAGWVQGVRIKTDRMLRLDVGPLVRGGAQHVLIKTRLPALSSPGSSPQRRPTKTWPSSRCGTRT